MQESFSSGSVFDRNSRILILGNFPSIQSHATRFYYANPQSRFQRVFAAVYQKVVPEMVEEKHALLLSHGLTPWDILERCEVQGSSNASVWDVVPVNIEAITREVRIHRVLINSIVTTKYYARCLEAKTGIPAICLPSMNPTDTSYRLECLTGL